MQISDDYVELGGTKVHYERCDAPADGPVFVLVHGLGGSLDNWAAVAPILAARGPVLSLDLGGFGRTQVHPRDASVPANLRLLQRFVKEMVGRPAIVAGNSMGGLLTAQLAARDPDLVAGAVLVDPAIPLVFRGYPHREVLRDFALTTLPGLSRIAAKRLAASTVQQEVEYTIRMVTTTFDDIDPELVDRHVRLSEYRLQHVRGAGESFEVAARSLLAMLARRKRYYAVVGRIAKPVLLLHGDQDKLVHVRSARALAKRNPSWTYVEGKCIGHSPMFDFPDWTTEQIVRWLDRRPDVSAGARA